MFSKLITTAAVFMVVAVGTATAGTTPQGLKADGLRLQAMAERYQQLRGTTPEGITADGLRLQAIARAYQSRPAASYYTPRALHADVDPFVTGDRVELARVGQEGHGFEDHRADRRPARGRSALWTAGRLCTARRSDLTPRRRGSMAPRK